MDTPRVSQPQAPKAPQATTIYIAPTSLLTEALRILRTGGPRRPTRAHLRAVAGAVAALVDAAQRLDAAATSHAACLGCPLCGLRAELQALGLRAPAQAGQEG
jgi:hypothetical protein